MRMEKGGGGCEQSIEVFVRIEKKWGQGVVRVDLTKELDCREGGGGVRSFVKIKKKLFWGWL